MGRGRGGGMVGSHDLAHRVENAPVIYSKEASEPLPPYLTKTSIVCHSPSFRPLSLPPSLPPFATAATAASTPLRSCEPERGRNHF